MCVWAGGAGGGGGGAVRRVFRSEVWALRSDELGRELWWRVKYSEMAVRYGCTCLCAHSLRCHSRHRCIV